MRVILTAFFCFCLLQCYAFFSKTDVSFDVLPTPHTIILYNAAYYIIINEFRENEQMINEKRNKVKNERIVFCTIYIFSPYTIFYFEFIYRPKCNS